MSFASGKPDNTAFEMSPSPALSIAIAWECPPEPNSKNYYIHCTSQKWSLNLRQAPIKIQAFRADLTWKSSRQWLRSGKRADLPKRPARTLAAVDADN